MCQPTDYSSKIGKRTLPTDSLGVTLSTSVSKDNKLFTAKLIRVIYMSTDKPIPFRLNYPVFNFLQCMNRQAHKLLCQTYLPSVFWL